MAHPAVVQPPSGDRWARKIRLRIGIALDSYRYLAAWG